MAVGTRPDTRRPQPTRRRRGEGAVEAGRAPGAAREGERFLTDGDHVAAFIESFLRITKGEDAGQLVRLRPWQRDILRDLFRLRADGVRQHRVGLLGLPRKNGKSLLASGIALDGLFDEPGALVVCAAAEKEQARIVFQEAKRAVEMDPELSTVLKVYRDAIEYPQLGSVLRVVSAEAYSKEGLNISRAVVDELHAHPNDDLWHVLTLGSGTRRQPLILAITTAGVRTDATGQDSIAYRLYQYGKRIASGEESDPSFYFRWFEAPEDADYQDPETWAAANPALGDYLRLDDFETVIRTTPAPEFITKRLNRFVASVDAWLPAGALEARAADRRLQPGEDVILGFDGSFNADCSVLVAASVAAPHHVELVAMWEKPDGAVDWQVPIAEVEATVLDAFRRYRVVELVADPFRWARELQGWGAAGLPVAEYPTTSVARMVPACAKFYDAVMTGNVTTSGDPRLERHFRNAVVKVDRLGPRIVKEHRGSPRRIDAAVAAVMAHDRATFHAQQPSAPVPEFITL